MHIFLRETASFDIDPQKGLTPLCPSEMPVKEGQTIVKELNDNAKCARLRLLSMECHPSNPAWKDTIPLHCVSRTTGGELLDGLPPWHTYNYIVPKGATPSIIHINSSIYHDVPKSISTGVVEYLREQHISTVVLGGLIFDFAVKETASDLRKAGFRVMINMLATRALSDDSAFKALKEIHKRSILCFNGIQQLTVHK